MFMKMLLDFIRSMDLQICRVGHFPSTFLHFYNKKCNIDLLSMFITQSKASKLKRLIAILKTTILEAVKICNNIFGRQLWKTTYTWVSFCRAGKCPFCVFSDAQYEQEEQYKHLRVDFRAFFSSSFFVEK